MDGDSLDDFFAKKDKSKKKGKAKITPGDILAKQEEKPKKKTKKKTDDKPSSGQDGTEDREKNSNTPQPEDEEWVDYEQEEKDYSGLRIQTLQIRDESSDDEDRKRDSGDEGGEEGEKGEASRGPWNKGGQATTPAQREEPESRPEHKPEPSKEEASSKGPSKYVPPGMRAAQAAAASSSGPTPLRRGKKNAPNISSEEDFPTLGMVAPVEAPDSNPTSFERVRGGGRQVEDDRNKGLQLQLGNKFASLGE